MRWMTLTLAVLLLGLVINTHARRSMRRGSTQDRSGSNDVDRRQKDAGSHSRDASGSNDVDRRQKDARSHSRDASGSKDVNRRQKDAGSHSRDARNSHKSGSKDVNRRTKDVRENKKSGRTLSRETGPCVDTAKRSSTCASIVKKNRCYSSGGRDCRASCAFCVLPGADNSCPRGYSFDAEKQTCEDIDECSTKNFRSDRVCGESTKCTNKGGDYDCSCGQSNNAVHDTNTNSLECVEQILCKGTGDPHFENVRGETFDHQGTCTYRYMETGDGIKPSIAVKGKLHHLGTKTSVSYNKKITATYTSLESVVSVVVLEGYTVKINGNEEDGGYAKDGVRVYRTGNDDTTLEVLFDGGYHLAWSKGKNIMISAPKTVGNNIRGLCGNLVDAQVGDRSNWCNYVAKSRIDVNEQCDLTCDLPDTDPSFIDKCKLMQQSSPFKAYYEQKGDANMVESCSLEMAIGAGWCTFAESEAQSALTQGFNDAANWRQHELFKDACPFHCHPNSHYMANRPVVIPSCVEPNPVELEYSGLEGCRCNDGYLESNGKCVLCGKCGSLIGGTYLASGERRVMEHDGQMVLVKSYQQQATAYPASCVGGSFSITDDGITCSGQRITDQDNQYLIDNDEGYDPSQGNECPGAQVIVETPPVFVQPMNEPSADCKDSSESVSRRCRRAAKKNNCNTDWAIENCQRSCKLCVGTMSDGNCPPNYESIDGTCKDIDECAPRNNKCGGKCVNLAGSSECQCESGIPVRQADGSIECKSSQRCRATGDPHYQTFAGKRFDFQGACEYTYLNTVNWDKVDIRINAQLKRSDSKPVSTNQYTETTIFDKVTKEEWVVRFEGLEVFVNNIRVAPEYSFDGNTITAGDKGTIYLETKYGINLKWAKRKDLYIDLVTDIDQATLDGMCIGQKFNGRNQYTWSEYGDAYKYDPEGIKCTQTGASPDPDPVMVDKCQQFVSDTPEQFNDYVHGDFDTAVFVHECAVDLSNRDGKSVEDAFCTVLAELVAEAAEKHQPITKWRMPLGCPLPCTANSHFVDNAPVYPVACNDPEPNLTEIGGEGCVCDEGFFDSDGECVTLEHCGCELDGEYHKSLDSWYQYSAERETYVHCTCDNRQITSTDVKCFDGSFRPFDGALTCVDEDGQPMEPEQTSDEDVNIPNDPDYQTSQEEAATSELSVEDPEEPKEPEKPELPIFFDPPPQPPQEEPKPEPEEPKAEPEPEEPKPEAVAAPVMPEPEPEPETPKAPKPEQPNRRRTKPSMDKPRGGVPVAPDQKDVEINDVVPDRKDRRGNRDQPRKGRKDREPEAGVPEETQEEPEVPAAPKPQQPGRQREKAPRDEAPRARPGRKIEAVADVDEFAKIRNNDQPKRNRDQPQRNRDQPKDNTDEQTIEEPETQEVAKPKTPERNRQQREPSVRPQRGEKPDDTIDVSNVVADSPRSQDGRRRQRQPRKEVPEDAPEDIRPVDVVNKPERDGNRRRPAGDETKPVRPEETQRDIADTPRGEPKRDRTVQRGDLVRPQRDPRQQRAPANEAGTPEERPIRGRAPTKPEDIPVRDRVLNRDRPTNRDRRGRDRKPAVDEPVDNAPAVEAPVDNAPAVEAPVAKAPAVEAPVDKAPAVEAPVDNVPAVEAPVDNAPAVEAPVDNAPAVDEPAGPSDPLFAPFNTVMRDAPPKKQEELQELVKDELNNDPEGEKVDDEYTIEYFSKEQQHLKPRALGMESLVIPDGALHASRSKAGRGPAEGRPGVPYSWIADPTDPDIFFTIDLEVEIPVHGVGIVGNAEEGCWITGFYIDVQRTHDGEWETLQKKDSTGPRLFKGNDDAIAKKLHCLHRYYGAPLSLFGIRFRPAAGKFVNEICGSFELYGFRRPNDPVFLKALKADVYTKSITGCEAYWLEDSEQDYACCQKECCQCGGLYPAQCVPCGMGIPLCGIASLYKEGILEGSFMISRTGCQCKYDRTKYDCVCCDLAHRQSHDGKSCVDYGHDFTNTEPADDIPASVYVQENVKIEAEIKLEGIVEPLMDYPFPKTNIGFGTGSDTGLDFGIDGPDDDEPTCTPSCTTCP